MDNLILVLQNVKFQFRDSKVLINLISISTNILKSHSTERIQLLQTAREYITEELLSKPISDIEKSLCHCVLTQLVLLEDLPESEPISKPLVRSRKKKTSKSSDNSRGSPEGHSVSPTPVKNAEDTEAADVPNDAEHELISRTLRTSTSFTEMETAGPAFVTESECVWTKEEVTCQKRIAQVLRDTPLPEIGGGGDTATSTWYLHEFSVVNWRDKISVRFVLPRRLQQLPSFTLYPRRSHSGHLVTIRYKSTVSLTQQQIGEVKTFTVGLIANVLTPHDSTFNDEPRILLAVVDGAETIDWKYMEHLLKRLDEWKDKTMEDAQLLPKEEYKDAVVTRNYLEFKKDYFIVLDMRNQRTVEDLAFKGSMQTHIEYLNTKYHITLKHSKQHLLCVKQTSRRFALVAPREKHDMPIVRDKVLVSTSAFPLKSQLQTIELVPEVCLIHPVPASLWRLVTLLPSATYRLNGLLVADELRVRLWPIAKDVDPTLIPLPLEDRIFAPLIPKEVKSTVESEMVGDGDLKVTDFSPVYSKPKVGIDTPWLYDRTDVGPPHIRDVLEAITLADSNDLISLERFEIIGDSLLKFAATLHVLDSDPKEMSGKRSQLVSNAHLFELGCNFGLATFIHAKSFLPDQSWIPLGYGEQTLKLKKIADVVEGLLGCALVHHGISSAIALLARMGHVSGNLRDIEYDVIAGVAVSLTDDLKLYADLGFSGAEAIIGYVFKDKRLLVAAFTCGRYEVLEFLGDAVLDYLVLRHYYENNSRYPPGLLSDLKMACVNNEKFDELMREFRLDQYVYHTNSQVMEGWKTTSKPIKIKADMFEALIGAIYLDCDPLSVFKDDTPTNRLKLVWKVMYPLLEVMLDKEQDNMTINPVRRVYEKFGPTVVFSSGVKVIKGWKVTLTLPGKNKPYEAVAVNQCIAKNDVAKKALL